MSHDSTQINSTGNPLELQRDIKVQKESRRVKRGRREIVRNYIYPNDTGRPNNEQGNGTTTTIRKEH